MSGDSHAERNAAMLRQLERAQSRALVDSHNALVSAIDTVDDELNEHVLDEDQVETVETAVDQIEAVAVSIRDDDRVHDDRLLAIPERRK